MYFTSLKERFNFLTCFPDIFLMCWNSAEIIVGGPGPDCDGTMEGISAVICPSWLFFFASVLRAEVVVDADSASASLSLASESLETLAYACWLAVNACDTGRVSLHSVNHSLNLHLLGLPFCDDRVRQLFRGIHRQPFRSL